MKLNILVVEDNADTRLLLGILLDSTGHAVRTVGNLRAALDAVEAEPIDVLISDIGLPDGTGRDLIEHLRRRHSAPIAIATSGYGTVVDVNSNLAAGFRHHLTKPIDFQQLVELIDAASAERQPAR